uniref:Transposase n=1 Tax=Thermofilum pendens TaxID=2269 RepID=A0A7C4B9L9_THEPE
MVPLNAWAQLLVGRGDLRGSGGSGAWAEAVWVWRCDTVKLLPTPEQEELLRRVGDATARLINMENYRRRRLFFEGRGIDKSWQSAWERRRTEYVEVYRLLGSRNFHEVCRVVGEAWRSFAELLKARREGRLEPWQEPRPPGYRKREGQRLPIVIVRFDNYRVDLERRVLHLGYWNIELRFAGKPRWLTRPNAKQGRLILTYDEVKRRWYARVSVEVLLQTSSTPGPKAGIDPGREILAAVAAEDGTALLYRGGVLKSEYFYFERRVSEVERALNLEEVDQEVLREKRRWLFDMRKRRMEQIFANMAAHMARELARRGVGVVFLGYPRGIAHDHVGKGNTNLWSYKKLITRLATTLENHGIAAFAVAEDGTSMTCARHGCEVARRPRGLVWCPHGHVAHSDVNAALNILLRGLSALGLAAELPGRVKVYSYTPTPSRVVEPKKKRP